MTDENTNVDDELSPSEVQTETEVDTTAEVENQPGKKSAEARINELLSKNKELESKLTTIEERMATPPPPPTVSTETPTPEVQKAVEYLKKLGFTTKEDQEKKIREIEDRMFLNNEHTRLENRLSGEDGKPKYVRTEVESYMRKRGIYDPEAAYEQMNKKELFDYELKRYDADRKKKPFVQKPGGTGDRQENSITSEKIADWLKTPEGRVKYEQNREKILKLMAQGLL